jgi:integrase
MQKTCRFCRRPPEPHRLPCAQHYWLLGRKRLADIKGSTCRAYTRWRVENGRKEATARRELKTLSAAINHWHRESPLGSVPSVSLPPDGTRRERFLERQEAAALLEAARRLGHTHVARFILIGLYTGTRHAAILKLRWGKSLAGGHVDLERGILYRRGLGDSETSKRRPPLRITPRLCGHFQRWRRSGAIHDNIVNYGGKPILKMRRAWNTVVREAGLGKDVTPHCLKHSYVTWRFWDDDSIYDISRDTGTSIQILENVYGHHRPVDGSVVRGFKPLHHRNPERQEKRA